MNILLSVNNRDLTNADAGLLVYCVSAGNPDGYYFRANAYMYPYRQVHEADCWKGVLTEGRFINGLTCAPYDNALPMTAYARYAESHWYWSDDEYWAFVHNPDGYFFFLMYAC